jgi:hypothetical protein
VQYYENSQDLDGLDLRENTRRAVKEKKLDENLKDDIPEWPSG